MLLILDKPLKEGIHPPPLHPKVVVTEESRTPCCKKISLRSWRYCLGARLKFWRRSRVPKKGSRDEAVFLAASPLVTAPPSNLTRLYYHGSAAKSHSTTTQCRQLRRLQKNGRLGLTLLSCFWRLLIYDLFSFQVLKLEVHCHHWTGRKWNEIPDYITKLLLFLFLSREFLLVPMNTVIPILWFFM